MSEDKHTTTEKKPGRLLRVWRWWRRPSRLALGTLLLLGFGAGIIFWGGFNTGMEAANTEQFCIGCHETVSYTHLDVYKRQVAACTGCGACVAGCPAGAVTLTQSENNDE